MHNLLTAGLLITFGILIISIIGGCSEDEDPIEYGDIKLLATVPGDGGTIAPTGQLKMVFDGFPGTVTVDGTEAKIMEDNTAIVQIADLPNAGTGPDKTVIISWTNLDNSFFGTQTLSFTIVKRATTVVMDPPPRARTDGVVYLIYPTTEFTLMFNEEVVGVTVNGTPAKGWGRNWKWSAQPYLPEGLVLVVVEWINRDGSAGIMEVGPYSVGWGGGDPAAITSGTVSDGAADVDPGPINVGGFRFDFDERITGTINLTDEAGANLNWIGNVADQTATLTPVAGQELVNETTYKIEIDVRDGSGNQLKATITFVTKPK